MRRNSSTLAVYSRRPSGWSVARSARVVDPAVVSKGSTRAATSSISSSVSASARTARWWVSRKRRARTESVASVSSSHRRTCAPSASRVASRTSSSYSPSRDAVGRSTDASRTHRTKNAHGGSRSSTALPRSMRLR
ncbi:Uncharacterised protein [Mycobacteroides abscessus]|nr:Uncharacterised protein [Mycobacteroides abscessus]